MLRDQDFVKVFHDGTILRGRMEELKIGETILYRGFPHVVIDAGPDQGKRIAAYQEPYSFVKI